jgi:hypothetical protein
VVVEKSYLSRVKDSLDRRDKSILILLELRVLFYRLLHQQLNVSELAEVEISLLLQSGNGLLELRILLLQNSRGSATSKRCPGPCGTAAADSRGSSALLLLPDRRLGVSADNTGLTLSAGEGVVVSARIVLVPVSLGPLKELEVVLHLALYELLNVNRSVDVLLGEVYYRTVSKLFYLASELRIVPVRTLKLLMYSYSDLALNLILCIGTSPKFCQTFVLKLHRHQTSE